MTAPTILPEPSWHGHAIPPPPAPAPAVAPRATVTQVAEAPSVLVVDDEAHIVEFLALLLEEEGFRVFRAYDGEQAWHLAVAERPSLVISDVMMPRLSGHELLHRLRSGDDVLSRMPVILMSTVDRTGDTLDVAFIPKPFDIDRMLTLVNTNLDAG